MPYSTNGYTAMDLIPYLVVEGFVFTLWHDSEHYYASFQEGETSTDPSRKADTLPLALCHAALQARYLEHEQGDNHDG